MKHTAMGLLTAAALGAMASAGAAETAGQSQEPEGLYTADQLMDADVYAQGSQQQIGEIEDLVLDNSMTIRSFVVEADGNFGLGGESYVVPTDHVQVQARPGDEAKEPEYKVTLDMTAAQLAQQPVYSNSWWNKTRQQAQTAWQQTQKHAGSAWTQIKQGASSAYDSAQDVVHSAAESAAEATDRN